MKELNRVTIDTSQGERTFEMYQGDVAALDCTIDLLIISTIGADYSPLRGTVVGALSSRLGISVEDLSKEPEVEFVLPAGRLWVSKGVDPDRIGRIMCVEIPYEGGSANQIVLQAFLSLPMLEARGILLKKICLPVLGTGAAGLDAADLVRPILQGAEWALRHVVSAERVLFVEINPQTAEKMNEAMDDVLGRVKLTVANDALAKAIQKEILNQLDRLERNDNEAHTVVEYLRRAVRDGSRSADVGMACRHLREYVIARILDIKDRKETQKWKEIYDRLQKDQIADWVISYLNLLRTFGNEAAHHKTMNTYPQELRERDLVTCLFVIQRVLDFWFGWHATKLEGHAKIL
jgi:hypothetical protein